MGRFHGWGVSLVFVLRTLYSTHRTNVHRIVYKKTNKLPTVAHKVLCLCGVAENEGFGYQTVINNTLRQALLGDGSKNAATAVANAGHFKDGMTAGELRSLEKKLTEVLSEIHRVLTP